MKRFVYAFVFIITSMRAYACDVCGCSASSQYLGILPQFNMNFIGFQYQYSAFTSDHPSLFDSKVTEHSNDVYHTFQLWGKYDIGSKYQVFAFIPYRYNIHSGTDTNISNNGIGDISVILDRVWIRKERNSWKHLLLAGVGIKAPTGSNTGITELDRQGLPNMQAGTGSWDFMVNTNYTLSHHNSGLNLDAAYTFTTANKYDYKYGNKLNAGVSAFHSFKRHKITLIPLAGFRYEYTLHDYDNYSKKWLNEQSGGYICYTTAEVQAYYQKLGFRIACQLPVAQYYGAGYLNADAKAETGVFISF